jgi:sugar phosphate isomerase/epimerase
MTIKEGPVARHYSLAYLTGAPLDPVAAIELAAKLGYQAVGLRITPAAPGGDFSPLIEQPALLKVTVAQLKATGLSVFDVEIVRLDARFDAKTLKPFLDVCGALGAKAILVAGDDPDEARLTASYAEFCQAARPYGLTADLEFMPFTQVRNANAALRIVTKAAQPNGGILVDVLHAARSATTLADLRALPRSLLHYVQICDAPAGTPATNTELIHTARHARLLPGDGGIELRAMFDSLPRDVPVSIEIPNDILKAERGIETWAKQALAASQKTLGDAPSP